MRVEVAGDEKIGSQVRAYAEYRVFAALTQATNAETVTHAHVVLRSGRGQRGVACTVTIASRGSDVLRVRATGEHACEAINRAVERLVFPPQRPDRTRDDGSSVVRAFRAPVKTYAPRP